MEETREVEFREGVWVCEEWYSDWRGEEWAIAERFVRKREEISKGIALTWGKKERYLFKEKHGNWVIVEEKNRAI